MEADMTVDTAGFREAHHELRDQTAELRLAAERVPELTNDEREEARARIVAYLRERVAPHSKLDELLLYPDVATRLGDPLVAVSMNYDHLAIRHWIERIATVDITDTALLQQLLYGLDALVRVHLWKEDELFLARLESFSWPALATSASPEEMDA
jgi:Hemerythrin HHE cation binding domain